MLFFCFPVSSAGFTRCVKCSEVHTFVANSYSRGKLPSLFDNALHTDRIVFSNTNDILLVINAANTT